MVLGLKNCLKQIAAKGSIDENDVFVLRQDIFSDQIIDASEAGLFLEIDANVQKALPVWQTLFSEIMYDFCVYSEDGNRKLNQTNLSFLLSKFVNSDGRIGKLNQVQILSKIAAAIDYGAIDLNLAILKEIEKSVETGIGATKTEGEAPYSINEIEIEIIRQVLHNVGGDNGMVISKAEAEYIQRIKDIIVQGTATLGFEELYVKAIANHYRAHNFDSPNYPSNYTNSQFFDSLRAGLAGNIRNFWDDAHNEETIAKTENFDTIEQKSFENIINSDGKIDDYEAKALNYLKSA